MLIITFLGWILLGFAGMEVISYLVHRFVFHGLLWHVHRSHHEPNHGLFELNDLFSIFFAGLAIYFMYQGMDAPLRSPLFGTGLGITVYGLLYFVIHDLFSHKRFMPFKSDNRLMRLIRYAHQRHHQSIDKEGQEPYGLFLFPYDKYKND